MGDIDESAVCAALHQCQFFVVRKKRLCRMTVRPGRQYCGEHEPEPNIQDGVADQRIPCPNDPKHTCYMSKLEKHLIKCNARKGEDPPYIIQDINGPADVEAPPRIPLRDVPEETLIKVIEKVNKLYDQHLKDEITTFTPQEEPHIAVREELDEAGRSDSSRRHLRQVSRLLLLAEEEGLKEDHTCYVELGAGKGMMSYYMAVVWCPTSSRVVAIDRAAMRHKRDTQQPHATRVRADLRHVALARLQPARDASAVLGLAKHLCGVATDYAIRCLTQEEVVSKTRGALIATCCHHRCELAAYCGNQHLQALGVAPEELNIMFSVVSWATCGDGRSRDLRKLSPTHHTDGSFHHLTRQDLDSPGDTDVDSFHQPSDRDLDSPGDTDEGLSPRTFTQEYREAVGRRAKALVDYGRVLYLAEQGFRAKLCYYVPTTESLENVCIVAKKDVL